MLQLLLHVTFPPTFNINIIRDFDQSVFGQEHYSNYSTGWTVVVWELVKICWTDETIWTGFMRGWTSPELEAEFVYSKVALALQLQAKLFIFLVLAETHHIMKSKRHLVVF